MKIRLTHDTAVRYKAGTVLEVEDQEALRLIAFNNAEKVEETKPVKKATTRKKAGK